ncbi:MAG: DUF58 domain-containing protein [Acidimicrobiales bacterium]
MPIDDPRLLGALERLQLRTRRPLAGKISGEHRSKRYGSSLDFADFREYQQGDDFRRIDYLTLARLDQMLIRLYEAEDDLVVRLVVDTSASMGLDGKLRRAAEVAAAIGFVALTRRDVVTVHTVGATGRSQVARFSSRTSWSRLRDHLAGLEAQGSGSLVAVAGELLSRSGPNGLTVLLSDLLDEGWEPALNRLPARGADLAVIQVLGKGELDPQVAGDVDLVDVETGRRMAMSLTDASIKRYEERRDAWLEQVATRVAGLNAGYTLVSADDDLKQVLLGSLRSGGVVS